MGRSLRQVRSSTAVLTAAAFFFGGRCPAATGTAGSPHLAVERGLQFLQKDAFRWKETRKCAACHHAATMIWTFNEARARGYSIDERALGEITEWAFGDMKTNSLAEQAPPRDVINLGWVYVLLSVETAPGLKPLAAHNTSNAATDASVETNQDPITAARRTLLKQIVAKQVSDGSWGLPLDERVPFGGPVEDIAILSRLALLESGVSSKEVTECITKAAGWLSAHHDQTSQQGRNLRLLMSLREGTAARELSPVIASIRSEQNSDGG